MQMIKKGDKNFESTLDKLYTRYKGYRGNPEDETIINFHKAEMAEEGVVTIYSSMSAIHTCIKRCRAGIKAVEIMGTSAHAGVTLYIDKSYVREPYYILRNNRPKK